MISVRARRSILAVALVLIGSRPAFAQIEAGDKAVSVFGSVSFQNGTDGSGGNTTGSLFGSIQYFLSRQFALRANVFELISSSSSVDPFSGAATTNTLTATQVGGGVEYDLQVGENTTVPFVAFDVTTSSGGGSSTLLSPSVGARFFMNRNTAFNVAGVYQQSTQSGAPATVMLQLGLSVFFGGDKRK